MEKVNKITNKNHFFEVGKNYVIRTVTMTNVGKLVAVGEQELLMEDASWIADSGRWHKFLKGEFESSVEIEPFPDGNIIIGRGEIVDAVIWNYPLPRHTK